MISDDNHGLEGRKWEILQTAVNLFAEKGYNTTSIRDLASAVNLRPGAIYHYYVSKEEILNTIFDYDAYVAKQLIPILESAVEDASDLTKHPLEALYKIHCHTDQETRGFRNRITAVAVELLYTDERARELIMRNLITQLRKYSRRILETLVSLNRIEPLNIDTFTEIHANHTLSSCIRGYGEAAISTEEWKSGLDMLFSMIQIREELPAPLPNANFYYADQGWV